MPSFELVIGTLGLQGLKPLVYRRALEQQSPAKAANDYPEQRATTVGDINGTSVEETRKSYLGTPVFSDLNFPGPEEGDDVILETVLIDVSQRKNIVTTPVAGRNGTVKEYISDGDYEVRIRGVLVTPGTSAYPYDQVRALHDRLRQPEALDIICDYLRFFDIYKLVVTEFNFPQNEGFQNVQAYEITCISDLPEELIEEEDATPDQ